MQNKDKKNKQGGKRIGAGRKLYPIKTKTKQVRGISIELFLAIQKIDKKIFKTKTIKFWESLIEQEGIKLTEKLLKKCKFLEFEKNGIKGFVNYFYLYIIENKFYFFYNVIYDISIDNPFKTEIKYLNQLQNLYFLLTNKQLNINFA